MKLPLWTPSVVGIVSFHVDNNLQLLVGNESMAAFYSHKKGHTFNWDSYFPIWSNRGHLLTLDSEIVLYFPYSFKLRTLHYRWFQIRCTSIYMVQIILVQLLDCFLIIQRHLEPLTNNSLGEQCSSTDLCQIPLSICHLTNATITSSVDLKKVFSCLNESVAYYAIPGVSLTATSSLNVLNH